MAATMAFAAFHPFPNLRRVPFLRRISAATEFNISFGAAPSPDVKEDSPKTLVPDPSSPDPSAAPVPMLIPWIVRGEDGQLTLQSTPPARFLQAMAEAKMAKKEKKKVDKKKPSGATATAPPSLASTTSVPKYSKAARRFYNQNIREQPQRLSKVLAAAGVASRRSCEELIFEGKVTVNGSVCTSPQSRVDLAKDSIYVNGNRLSKKLPPKLYFALNKPKGYICSGVEDSKSVVSLFGDFLKNWSKSNPGLPKPRLFTVGRLDVATTGLIIVTNDGDFAQRISHPSSELRKEYIATVDGKVNRRHLGALSEGTKVEGVHCIPDLVELLSNQPDASRPRLRIVVHDGRNHEVRELVKIAGLQLYSLKRVGIGGFRLPSDLGCKSVQALCNFNWESAHATVPFSRSTAVRYRFGVRVIYRRPWIDGEDRWQSTTAAGSFSASTTVATRTMLRPTFARSNLCCGWICIIFGVISFVVFCYAAIISKLLSESRNPILLSIQNDWYYCFLVPLTLPVMIILVYLHWLSMKLFKHA
ncbi:ribosomal large subunit pseudouridine synthase [Musa troglodytarum]|uniref:Ribosomal large subunit pseudouridine synthase n=1 Tax=Musa troglodytarum TaxID=320322 RepID=A0A9E7FWZ5_9LILI|nr:ribosomal large subunit pseudouridine synthase [Musa troglodytarum]